MGIGPIVPDHSADEFAEWYETGLARGWVSFPTCLHHNGFGGPLGLPVTLDEDQQIATGEDPCIPIARVWGPDGPAEVHEFVWLPEKS